ncbi:hypothetical protein [Floridanema evergladense]|uniref:Transposase n=1 Tax=Floridaenema evergladense BLCC-F167 TaxID=3153639 RepID=A0ABV4WKY2_9CYAN
MLPNYSPMHPKQFRAELNLSRTQISMRYQVPENSLKNWLADENSATYREPNEMTKLYFGLLHALENSVH